VNPCTIMQGLAYKVPGAQLVVNAVCQSRLQAQTHVNKHKTCCAVCHSVAPLNAFSKACESRHVCIQLHTINFCKPARVTVNLSQCNVMCCRAIIICRCRQDTIRDFVLANFTLFRRQDSDQDHYRYSVQSWPSELSDETCYWKPEITDASNAPS